MSGALVQLVAYGSEDISLTSNPEMSFFNSVYKRYTNFSMESIENLFTDKPKFGTMNTIKIKRYGDLVSDMYLELILPYDPCLVDSFWTNRIGFNLLKKVELYIGKKLIDTMYGLWCHIWVELTHPIDKKLLIGKMIGCTGLNGYSGGLPVNIPHRLNIPLFFSFCRHPGLAIPLLAIQNNQEITLKFFFNNKINCIQKGNMPLGDISHLKLWVEYIYLEKEEQVKFAQTPLEFLIETTQHFTWNLPRGIKNISLPFNMMCKEMMWVVRKNNNKDSCNTRLPAIMDSCINNYGDKFTNFTFDHIISMVKKVQFKFNSLDVFSSGYRMNDYFNYIIPYQSHTGCPDLGINAYSFSLYPENLEPSGIINFLHLNSANINIESYHGGVLEMFSFNYNILSFSNGDFSLAYN